MLGRGLHGAALWTGSVRKASERSIRIVVVFIYSRRQENNNNKGAGQQDRVAALSMPYIGRRDTETTNAPPKGNPKPRIAGLKRDPKPRIVLQRGTQTTNVGHPNHECWEISCFPVVSVTSNLKPRQGGTQTTNTRRAWITQACGRNGTSNHGNRLRGVGKNRNLKPRIGVCPTERDGKVSPLSR